MDVEGTDPYDYCFFLLLSHSILLCEFSFDGVEEIMDCYVAGT